MQHQSSAFILLFFFFFLCIPKVLAVEWDDFADNFATDLAPLITLFGEQVTRQFLSESLSIWDNIIFAMAPLGLLTAVVSVIRVCGSASLRAFIGRAQESSGVAEIEVLSCTSATTGELFNARGGIARVFGSPQILEVVVTKPNDPDKPEFEVTTLQNAKESWVKVEPRRGGNNRQEKAETNEEREALLENLECQPSYRSPNLSLNVGIAKIPQGIIYLAAVFGMVLQAGVLIFAILTTHPKFVHRFTDPEESGPRPSYGLPFTLVGTILVCTGMFFCAYIIEQCTEEIEYKRSETQPSKVYWVQPGGQKIGDQVFESFIRESDEYKNLPRYIISTRSQKRSNRPILLGVALTCSLVGFVLQFVGLRALHSSVIFAQLGATLLMSVIRAILRMKRSDDGSNTIFSKSSGGERDQPSASSEPEIELEMIGPETIEPEMIEPWKENPEILHGHELDLLAMKVCKVDMIFLGAAEGAKIIFASLRSQVPSNFKEIQLEELQDDSLLDVRRQLAQLAKWPNFEVRDAASSLKSCIDGTLEIISPTIKAFGGKAQCFWPVFARSLTFGSPRKLDTKNIKMKLTKSEENGLWQAEGAELEALVGLWALSLHRGNYLEEKKLQISRGPVDQPPSNDPNPNPRPRPHRFYEESVRILSALDGSDDTTTAEQRLSSAERWSNIWVTRRSHITEKFKHIPDEDRREPSYGNNWAGTHIFGYSNGRKTFPGHSLVAKINNGSLSDSSLIRLCAQDIFCFFLETLVRTIDGSDIGGTTEVRPIVNQEDAVLLQNTVVEAIVDLFQSSGLGTREDAYMCVFPILRRTNKMPPASGVETAAIDRAEAYRGQGKWSKAFEILEWLCYDRLPPTPYRPVISWYSPRVEISLGDLCYAAIREKEDGVIRLGFESICRMLQSNIAPEFSRQYGQIGLQVCKDHDTPAFRKYYSLLQDASTNLDSFVEIYKDFDPLSSHRLGRWTAERNPAAIRYLVGRGVSTIDINILYDPGKTRFYSLGKCTAIHCAVRDNRIDIVHILLRAGASIGIQDSNGNSPSFIAADSGYSEILDMLIRYDLNAVRMTSTSRGRSGLSLLMIAAMNGHIECVEQILRALPLSVNSRSHNGDNALGIACKEIVKPQSWPIFGYEERRERYRAVIKALLEHGCDAQNQNRKGKTALHIAAKDGSELATSLILDSGVAIDINAQDLQGNTPLHFAMNSERIMELLIKAGANPTIRNKKGDTAFLTAIYKGLSPTSGNMFALLTSGIETRERDENIHDALVIEARRDNSDTVGFLLRKRRYPLSEPELKKMFLAGCENGRNRETSIDAKILEQIGRDVTWDYIRKSEDYDEGLPLSVLAADEGSTEILSLNQEGYVVYHNTRDEDGKTALHFAAEYGIIWLISELIQKGASPADRDDSQRIPFDYFLESATFEISDDEISSMLKLLICGEGAISIDCHDKDKRTPLYHVIGRMAHTNRDRDRKVYNTNQDNLAKRLLEMGANPDGFEGGPCPLEAAIRQDKFRIVQLLLEKYKADANYCTEGFETLLHQAAVGKTYIRIMETLLQHGADVNAALKNRATPLTYALSIYHHTNDAFYPPGDFYAIKHGLVFSRIKTLLNHGARVTGISYCHKCTARNGLLGDFVDDLLSPQNLTLRCKEDEKLPQAMKLLLAGWKNENPGKTKEDAMKELGGSVVWEKGGFWEDYEDINLGSLGVLPKSLPEALSKIEPPDQNIEGSLS
ncbi:hypothetical protein TWF173_007419 [Orbilia oligospora]|nr:hypothetical protein TWF173_007419 [Orbilia oligospora]